MMHWDCITIVDELWDLPYWLAYRVLCQIRWLLAQVPLHDQVVCYCMYVCVYVHMYVCMYVCILCVCMYIICMYVG